jgi:hypothetical protein
MTLPKGYVPPKKADDKAKQLVPAADDKAKQLVPAADDKAKQLVPASTPATADDKAKQLVPASTPATADDKAFSKRSNTELTPPENSYKKFGLENDVDYALIWDEMKKAYMQTVKEATISYFRLVDFWMKDFKK